jgi:hypothetical protein
MLETTRASLEVSNTAVAALDDRYAHLAPAELDALASALVDLAFAAVGAESGNLYLSPFAGFDLDDLAVARVDTASDAFLAFTASLGAFGGPPPSADPAPTPQPLATTVDVPTPAALRAALLAGDEDGLPAIRVALPTSDGPRPLEHAWRIEGGHWHAYEASGELVIRDRSFAWQAGAASSSARVSSETTPRPPISASSRRPSTGPRPRWCRSSRRWTRRS